MKKSPGAAEALLLIDSDLSGVKPRNVARFSLSRHRSPERTGGAPDPRAGLLLTSGICPLIRATVGPLLMSDRIALARAIAQAPNHASLKKRKIVRSPRSSSRRSAAF